MRLHQISNAYYHLLSLSRKTQTEDLQKLEEKIKDSDSLNKTNHGDSPATTKEDQMPGVSSDQDIDDSGPLCA